MQSKRILSVLPQTLQLSVLTHQQAHQQAQSNLNMSPARFFH